MVQNLEWDAICDLRCCSSGRVEAPQASAVALAGVIVSGGDVDAIGLVINNVSRRTPLDDTAASLLARLHALCMLCSADMGRPLQIRNVPEPVLQGLRERADEVHMSLSAYALEVLTEHVGTKTMNQILAGPRLRHGRQLANRELVDLISRGRR